MQKYKKAAISIAFLTMIFTAGMSAGYYVYGRSFDNPDEYKMAVLSTFEDNDYKAWKKVIGKRKGISRIIGQEEFRLFVEARKAVRSGEYDKALTISSELEDRLIKKIG